jgi:hypothetical protein
MIHDIGRDAEYIAEAIAARTRAERSAKERRTELVATRGD